MNSEAILAIGGTVGMLSKFIMAGMRFQGRWVTLVAVAVTTAVFAIWGYSHNDFTREATWPYFMAWVETLSIAAGAEGTAVTRDGAVIVGLVSSVAKIFSEAATADCSTLYLSLSS